MPGARPRKTTQRLTIEGSSSDDDEVGDDSVEGEDVSVADGVSEDSAEGEDGGGGGPWEGCWGKYIASKAASSARSSSSTGDNTESKLDEDERRLSPRVVWLCSRSVGGGREGAS